MLKTTKLLKEKILEDLKKNDHNLDLISSGAATIAIAESGYFKNVDLAFILLLTADGVQIRKKSRKINKTVHVWGQNLTSPKL